MILTYIDESGTPAIPGNTSHFILAGLSIPISKWKSCEKAVSKIKSKYSLGDSEIHTGWMMRPYLEQEHIDGFESMDYATRAFNVKKLRNQELLRLQRPNTQKHYHKTKKNYKQTAKYIHLSFAERKQFIKEVAQLIGSWSFVRLFGECIDKIHFNAEIAKKPVDEQAFEQLVSRLEQYLAIYTNSSKRKQYGLLIHDNNETVSKRHTLLMKQFHAKGTLWTKIRNIIETPLFVDSQLTSMIQLADLCAYALRRYLENSEEALFEPIFSVADKKENRVVGLRHFSETTCSCMICEARR